MNSKKSKGNPWALLPLGIFLILFVGSGIMTGDFYAMPVLVAFLLASVAAFMFNRKEHFNDKVAIFCKGAGNENIIMMVMIFLLAGAFSGVAKAMGGVEAMEKLAIERADMLYAELERSKVFRPVVKEGSRSRMNIPFLLREGYESLEKEFLDFAKTKNLVGLKGHRSVGGFRASTYNACTIEDVKALVAAMQEFEAKHI